MHGEQGPKFAGSDVGHPSGSRVKVLFWKNPRSTHEIRRLIQHTPFPFKSSQTTSWYLYSCQPVGLSLFSMPFLPPSGRPFTTFCAGAAVTLGSTFVSCGLALEIEKNAHRLFYWYAPQWYADVDKAYGLSAEQLADVRHFSKKPLPSLTASLEDKLRRLELSGEKNAFSDETVISVNIPRHYTQTVEVDADASQSPVDDLQSLTFNDDSSFTNSTNKNRIAVVTTTPKQAVEGLWRQELIACSMTG